MEEAISVSLNSIQPPREDRGGASTSRKTDVKYLQTKAMQEAHSPRLKKRGPIEAYEVARVCGKTAISPRLKKRGPIEAMAGNCSENASVSSPRLKKRGPIEAGFIVPLLFAHIHLSTLEEASPHCSF